MGAQLIIRRHPGGDKTVQTLPQCVIDSFEVFEGRLKCGGDLSAFINTQPFSSKDAVGNRTLIAHYHLPPCRPVCYLVGLVRTVDTAYVLDIFEHPPHGMFASIEIEERLYSRLSDVCPELAEYKLPGTYRSGLPVHKKDIYGATTLKGTPSVAPVRTSTSDYLPLGQLTSLSSEQSRIGVIVGTFVIPREEIPDEAIECFDCEDHPDRETLTLYIGGWKCYSGIYRKETEQLILWFCPLHNVVMQTSNRREPVAVALSEQDYRRLVDGLRARFSSADGKEQELGEIVDHLIEEFPLYRA